MTSNVILLMSFVANWGPFSPNGVFSRAKHSSIKKVAFLVVALKAVDF
jgi:hypothetical protein